MMVILLVAVGCMATAPKVILDITDLSVEASNLVTTYLTGEAARDFAHRHVDLYQPKGERVLDLPNTNYRLRQATYFTHENKTGDLYNMTERDQILRSVCKHILSRPAVIKFVYDHNVDVVIDEMIRYAAQDADPDAFGRSWRRAFTPDQINMMLFRYQEEAQRVTHYLAFAMSHTSELSALNKELTMANEAKDRAWDLYDSVYGEEPNRYQTQYDEAHSRQVAANKALVEFVQEQGGIPEGWHPYNPLPEVVQFFERARKRGGLKTWKDLAEDTAYRLGKRLP